ncbi:hypothetical protein ALQ70_101653 [Pseudomonas savastanoi pv. glycinea]|nr:hypothetical protein ALQ70_101653 [Pseudomonas savastanoi pv. glycinea]
MTGPVEEKFRQPDECRKIRAGAARFSSWQSDCQLFGFWYELY